MASVNIKLFGGNLLDAYDICNPNQEKDLEILELEICYNEMKLRDLKQVRNGKLSIELYNYFYN